MQTTNAIRVSNLCYSYGGTAGPAPAVNDVSFTVRQGEFYTLLGPSGCGKTTTLHCIAGLARPTSGEIELGGKTVVATDRFIPTHKRPVGMVFQDYAVWPHMSVYDNVAFPLTVARGVKSREIRDRVMSVLSVVGLEHIAERPATRLSGGQQQRVSLARALVREPDVLLLDEPLSNLDATLREEMRTELRQIQRRLQVTTVFVTHDQVEALSMSNRIAVMRDGVIVQEGVPREIYRRPNSAFVAKFIGASTFIPGVVRRVDRAADGVVTIVAQTIIGEIVGRGSDGLSANQDVVVAVRPEGVRLRSAGEPSGANIFEGVVDVSLYVGDSMLYRIDIAGQPIQAKADPDTEFAPHESLTVELPPQACVVVAADPTLDKAAGGNVEGGPGLPMPTAVSGTGAPLDVQ